MTTGGLEPSTDVEAPELGALQTLARALRVNRPTLSATLEAILGASLELIEGTDFAGINLLRGRVFEPQAVFGQPPIELDALQQASGSGPCLDASREQRLIRIDDLSDPEWRTPYRWPDYITRAMELGVRSMLCVPMWVDETKLGSISLYSRTVRAFGSTDEQLAGLLAAHAAIALADAQRIENLGQALHNRDLIGQAKGILMERHRITEDAAFAMLSAASQRANRKVSVIAEQLATTGQLPS